MQTLNTHIPAGRWGLLPIITETDETGFAESVDTRSVVLNPINEIDGDPADYSDEPEKIDVTREYVGYLSVYSNRSRLIEGLYLEVASTCAQRGAAKAWPTNQETSFDTPLGPLTVSDDYVLVPIESDRTNPNPDGCGAHNWLVFHVTEETSVVVENGAIVIGDTVIDLRNMAKDMAN